MAGSNSEKQAGRRIDLYGLIQHLHIRENKDQGIVLEEDLDELNAEARWTSLAEVSSSKTFSHAAFIANIKYAWSLSFKPIEENLFVLQFSCLAVWEIGAR